MESGIYIWGSSGDRWGELLSPASLAETHLLWSRDVEDLRPWSRSNIPVPNGEKSTVLWHSGSGLQEHVAIVFGRCPSSMDVAWALDAFMPLPDWSSVLAVEQAEGRGRHQRNWVSPPGNLHVTWVWPVAMETYGPVFEIPGLLSLVVGFMLSSAFREKGLQVDVKWPNDLFWKRRKIGGVLIEQRQGKVMVGVGINVAFAPLEQELERQWAPPAVSLAQAGFDFSPLSGWIELSRSAKRCLDDQIRHLSPEEFVPLIEERLVGVGEVVSVLSGQEEPYRARIDGLAPDGGLILTQKEARSVLYSGSILFPMNK